MAENQVQAHLISLGRGHNGFFCPDSRFHLMGGVKPQAYWPAAAPLTQAVKVGLRAGSLRDVNGTIPLEAYYYKGKNVVAAQPVKPESDDDDFIMDDDDKSPANDGKTPEGDGKDQAPGGNDGNDGNAPDGDKLTEEQIDATGRKDLLAYIKKHDIDMATLDLNSRSTEEDIKNALKIHFGYKMV